MVFTMTIFLSDSCVEEDKPKSRLKMKIGKRNGKIVTIEGEILTNYIPNIIAVVREHGCMAGDIDTSHNIHSEWATCNKRVRNPNKLHTKDNSRG